MHRLPQIHITPPWKNQRHSAIYYDVMTHLFILSTEMTRVTVSECLDHVPCDTEHTTKYTHTATLSDTIHVLVLTSLNNILFSRLLSFYDETSNYLAGLPSNSKKAFILQNKGLGSWLVQNRETEVTLRLRD